MRLTDEQTARLVQIRLKRPYLHCGDIDCGHSDDEHDAFDLGIADGEAGVHEDPFTDDTLSFAWVSGHSISSQMTNLTWVEV